MNGADMRHLSDDWTCRRWQIVQVDTGSGALVVDAIELRGTDDELGSGGLVTLTFLDDGATRSAGGAHERLRRWADTDDGVCVAFHKAALPYGCLALFQGGDSLILGVASGSGPDTDVV